MRMRFLFQCALSDEPFAELEFVRHAICVRCMRSSPSSFNSASPSRVGDVKHAVLHLDERGQFGKDQPCNGEQIALSLEQSA